MPLSMFKIKYVRLAQTVMRIVVGIVTHIIHQTVLLMLLETAPTGPFAVEIITLRPAAEFLMLVIVINILRATVMFIIVQIRGTWLLRTDSVMDHPGTQQHVLEVITLRPAPAQSRDGAMLTAATAHLKLGHPIA